MICTTAPKIPRWSLGLVHLFQETSWPTSPLMFDCSRGLLCSGRVELRPEDAETRHASGRDPRGRCTYGERTSDRRSLLDFCSRHQGDQSHLKDELGGNRGGTGCEG